MLYRISTTSGQCPVWTPDGTRIFYATTWFDTVMAVDIQLDPVLSQSEPQVVFSLPRFTVGAGPWRCGLEVTPEGEIVWDYWNTFGVDGTPPSDTAPSTPTQALFRATRIAPDHPGLAGRL